MDRTPKPTGRASRFTVGAGILAIAGLLIAGCTGTPDAEAFAPRWETTFDVATRVVASDDGVVIVASDEGQMLAALNTRNGGTRWSLPFTPPPSAVTVRGDVVTVQQQLETGVQVSAVSASTGNAMWTRTANGGSVIGAFSDGRVAAVRDDAVSISDVANVRTADPWMPRESCSVGSAHLSPGKDPWLAVLEVCDHGPSHLVRLDDSLREVWRTPAATAARFDFIDGLIAATDDAATDDAATNDAANLWLVGDDGSVVQALAGSIPPGATVVHRTAEDDVVAVTGSGELHPAGYLRAQNAPDLGVVTVARVGDGTDATLATVVGVDGELTPLKGDNYVLARQVGDTTVLTLWRWQESGTLPDDIPSWPDTFEVDAGSAERLTATATGEPGDLGFDLTRDGARFATVRAVTLASAASARAAFELTASAEAPADAATTVHRDDGTLTAVSGSCLLALHVETGPLAAADEKSLVDAIFSTETSGACEA
ncbi:outer membrane protein assembly factor BamB family protein [Microbacterium arborescens]